MSIGTFGPTPPSSQIGPPSVQKNTLAQQYALRDLSCDFKDERFAWQATDTARVARDQSNIFGEISAAGLPPDQEKRLRQDAEYPEPTALGADVLYLNAYMAPESPLIVAKTYKPADFDYLNNTSSEDDNTNSDNISDIGTTSALPDAGNSQGNPFKAPPSYTPSAQNTQPAPLNNLPGFGMAAPAA